MSDKQRAARAATALFLPLKKEFFSDFAAGKKKEEFRLYGPRWNERVCAVGRQIVLSCGYSGARLSGHVVGFRRRRLRDVPVAMQVYRDVSGDALVACIAVELDAAP